MWKTTKRRICALGALAVLACAPGCGDDGAQEGAVSNNGTTSTNNGTTSANNATTSTNSSTTNDGPKVEPAATPEAYFVDSYDAARSRFVATAEVMALIYADVEISAIDVPSQTDTDLTVDMVYVPATERPEKLLVVTSGVHGIEAFVGSAVQQMFIAEILPTLDRATLGVVLVHAVNPWGYRHHRRVSENNVDMNRNFSTERALFDIVNAPYGEIYDFLNPTGEVTEESIEGALGEVITFAVDYPRAELQQAILQGQYAFEDGLYYGGQAFEPQKPELEAYLADKVAAHDALFVMDLHTGYGERGRLHLFGAPGLGTPEAMEAVFAGFEIDTGENNDDFYETTGDFILYMGELAEAAGGKTYIGMTMEYGTLDSQTDIGAAQSLVNMRLENQGFHHGYATGAAEATVATQFMEMYNPSEAAWRQKIVNDTSAMVPTLLERFVRLGRRE